MKLEVYHIGLGSFGRYGFERLIELHKHFGDVDVRLKAVCDTDPKRLERAEKFAESQDISIETFENIDLMYQRAGDTENPVMVYDTGPSDEHAENIYRSMRYGFFHTAEKPPSMKREQHLKEKRLAERNNAMWKTDFIERENPVVKKTIEIIENQTIERIEVFRESSVGIEKMLDPVGRHGVKGGDILDKMTNEVYILDILKSAGQEPDLELEEAETKYFVPWRPNSEKLLSIDGGYEQDINYKTATGQTSAHLKSRDVEIELNTGWMGLSNNCLQKAKEIREITGHRPFSRKYSEIDETAYVKEEARFFILEGSRRVLGDMLNKKLYDLETGEEIETDYYLHDQLYRVLRKAVVTAAEENVDQNISEDIDVFMNSIFDVKESVSGGEFLEELDKGLEVFDSLTVEDRKVLETKETEFIPS